MVDEKEIKKDFKVGDRVLTQHGSTGHVVSISGPIAWVNLGFFVKTFDVLTLKLVEPETKKCPGCAGNTTWDGFKWSCKSCGYYDTTR